MYLFLDEIEYIKLKELRKIIQNKKKKLLENI